MAKKNRQNPPRPKEFKATPFSMLKGVALPESPKEQVVKPVVQKTEDSPEDDLDIFMSAVADVKPLRRQTSKVQDKSTGHRAVPERVKAVSVVDEQSRQLFVQEISRLKLDIRFEDSVSENDELQPLPNNRLRQVKRGIVSVDYQLDLHGLTREEALLALPRFLMTARQKGQKAVLVITGKGNHSVEEPVLNQAVASWLRDAGRDLIAEYAPAPREMGGSGAYVVFLRTFSPVRRPV
ncbi:MAG: Smr/MutS family protein [Geobacteraceae bacterium]|nr:Smr/MutS family protein [Geobacteraceae bacterium]